MTTFLKELCREKEQSINKLRKEKEKNSDLRTILKNLTTQLQDCKDRLKSKENDNIFLKHSAVYARLVRRERALRNARQMMCQAPRQESRLQKLKLRSLEKQISVIKNRLKESVASNRETMKLLKEALRQINHNNQRIHAAETHRPLLKEGQKFTDSVVTCTAQLIGECDIAAHTCAQVIKCVSRHLFECDIPDDDLPSKSSALRFADVGHVIAKMHAREQMTTKEYDLHCDGTSRCREKFVGQQVTLADNTTLSLGFQLTAREDSQSLLELTLHMFDELHYLDFDGRGEEQLKGMMRNMVGIMTDRANVMKCYQDAVEGKRKEILQSEEGITRLYCNAHFLLGLSAAASKALTAVEKERDFTKKLGRDSLPAYKRFSSVEPAAVRIIRLVCDVLGPRGDEKNGCRDDWIAFCSLRNVTSKLSSYRGNRFNNLFESAAAIVHHKDDICLFFSTYKDPSNLKQKSIVHDIQSAQIIAMVAALAVSFIFITGPFWQLIKSNTHYLDQGIFIQRMFANIRGAKDYTTTPEMLNACPTALQGFGLPPSEVVDRVYVYINNLPADLADILKDAVLSMMDEFAATTQRQLLQFLEGGVYSVPATPEQRQKMQHCKINNLFGEACLGDLDFSLFKRRNSSAHHHSTVNMLKRNKPISQFLLKKPDQEQHRLLSFARSKAAPLREKHRAQEKAVVQERQQFLLQQQAKTKRVAAMRERRRLDAVRAVQSQGGLCLDRASVERLLTQHRTMTAKFSALSVQLRYHRIVLCSKSKLLNKTKLSVDQIEANFIQYLESVNGEVALLEVDQMTADAADEMPADVPEHRGLTRGRKKKRNVTKKQDQDEEDGEEEQKKKAKEKKKKNQ